MKAIKISDQSHAELTSIVGQLIAESGQMKTYENAIQALLHCSIVMPLKFVAAIEDFLETNKQLGYSTKEEFVREAARWLMNNLREHKDDPLLNQMSDDAPQTSRPHNSASQDLIEKNQTRNQKPLFKPQKEVNEHG